MQDDLHIKAEQLQNCCISRATGGDGGEYAQLRRELRRHSVIKGLLPKFVNSCSDTDQFWGHIKPRFPSYHERREYIWEGFRPLLAWFENDAHSPADTLVQEALPKLESSYIHDVWQKALERRASDPDGAITIARTLLETVCKLVLDRSDTAYNKDASLPALYRLASEQLDLAPSQHTEQVFKQILGGCTSVVEGLGALRNRIGDAHGQGAKVYRPSPRHAELAVNLAGTMAIFLVSTWEVRKA